MDKMLTFLLLQLDMATAFNMQNSNGRPRHATLLIISVAIVNPVRLNLFPWQAGWVVPGLTSGWILPVVSVQCPGPMWLGPIGPCRGGWRGQLGPTWGKEVWPSSTGERQVCQIPTPKPHTQSESGHIPHSPYLTRLGHTMPPSSSPWTTHAPGGWGAMAVLEVAGVWQQ